MCGRIDIEPDDVAQFVDEARIVGQLELAHPVRLQTMGAPDALVELTLELPAALALKAPVQWVVSPGGSPSVKATTRSAASALSGLIGEGRVLSRTRPSNLVLHKAFLPAPNASLGLGRSPHDLVRADAIGGQQHDFSPPYVLLRRVAVLHHSFEPANIGGRNGEGFSCAHRADSRVEPASGNPSQDSNVRFDPLSHVRRFKAAGANILCSRSKRFKSTAVRQGQEARS